MDKKPAFLVGLFIVMLVLTGAGCISGSGSTTGPMGVFRSDDKGENWKKVATFPTAKGVQSIETVKVYRIFTDPSDPNALYLGTRGQGLYYSYNNGDSWQFANDLANKFIYSVAVDPKDKCTIYVTDGSSIYKTSDCSRTWTNIQTDPQPNSQITSLSVDYGNSQVVYAGVIG
jgi:photosystem II stability/assembly factor-like uncharacterized protein